MLTNLLGAAIGAFMLSGDGAVWVAPKKTCGRIRERDRVRVARLRDFGFCARLSGVRSTWAN